MTKEETIKDINKNIKLYGKARYAQGVTEGVLKVAKQVGIKEDREKYQGILKVYEESKKQFLDIINGDIESLDSFKKD